MPSQSKSSGQTGESPPRRHTAADPPREPDSTLRDLRSAQENVRGHNVRRATIAVLALIVVLGATGVFGMRSRTVSTAGGGYDLRLQYAAISRAGLDTPWRVTVHHAGGFKGPITLATTGYYFSMFESQGFIPSPDSETSSGDVYYQTFTPPPGDTFTVAYDAYIQPASQRGRSAITTLIIGGQELARVSYRTRLVP